MPRAPDDLSRTTPSRLSPSPRSSPAPRTIRAWLPSVVRGLVTAGVVVWLVVVAVRDWPAVRALEWTGSIADAGLATGFMVLGLLTLPAGLRWLAANIMAPRSPGAFAWRWWLQSYVYRYVPGKVMLVAERIRLGRQVEVPAGTSVVLVLWESLFQLLGGCLVIAVALPWAGGRASSLGTGVVGGVVAGVLLLIMLPRGLGWLLRAPLLQRKLGVVEPPRLPARSTVGLVLLYGAAWVALGLGFYFVARSFADLDGARAIEVVLWYVAAYVLGWLSSVAPAGLGMREGLIVFGLSDALGGTGPALALAAASRLWLTGIELVAAAASTRIRPPRPPTDA